MMRDVPPDDSSRNSPEAAETSPPQSEKLSNRASNVAAVAILLLIFLTPAAGFWWLRGMARQAAERNALSHTRDMLIRYMARTRGEWPRSWNDLKPDFKPADAGYGTLNIDELKEIVQIDFAFDPESVRENRPHRDEPPRIIRLKRRPDSPDVRQVNARIVEVLGKRRR